MYFCDNYALAVLLCAVTMFCWGSWGNTVGHGNPLCDKNFFLSSLEAARVEGLPFAVSEWNCGAPASFRSMGALAFGSYSASNGWSAA